jgi:glyoxylase-like metal-dependent hydrolase (beta-lactamase superfamily II)
VDPDDRITPMGDGITAIDTVMAGERELNAVYLIAASEPTLIEAGPGADHRRIVSALDRLDVTPDALAHIVVTHIHMDHAGGVGALLERYPRARVWVHEIGARHLVDPDRLVASTSRTYGEERMRALYGTMVASPADRVRGVGAGDVIDLGDRSLTVMHTPGHASHHVALHDDRSGAMWTGEAIGSYLPWADCYRPALPPPEVDVERALASIAAMRSRGPTALLTSHYGPVPDPDTAFDRAADRIGAWSAAVGAALTRAPDESDDELRAMLEGLARREFEADAHRPIDLERYDALGSIRMNAQGLARYWRKRWEREAETAPAQPSAASRSAASNADGS